MGMTVEMVAIDDKQLSQLQQDPLSVSATFTAAFEAKNGYVDIDKAWHGIDYLVGGFSRGGPPPWSHVIMGGDEIGEDSGYGPAMVLNKVDVKAVASALASLTDDQLRQRYAPDDMEAENIYPSVWADERMEAFDNYLMPLFRDLTKFYLVAASEHKNVLRRMI